MDFVRATVSDGDFMTELNKKLARRSRAPFAHYRKRIVVILEPGDVLAMRLERQRSVFRAPLANVYRQLAEWHAVAERRRLAEERKARKHHPIV